MPLVVLPFLGVLFIPPPPPHAGSTTVKASRAHSAIRPTIFFRRAEPDRTLRPTKANAGNGSQSALSIPAALREAVVEPTVVKVNIALPPPLVTVTGFVFPIEQVAAGLTTGATLHASITLPVYPLADARLNWVVEMLPALTVAGFGVPTEIE